MISKYAAVFAPLVELMERLRRAGKAYAEGLSLRACLTRERKLSETQRVTVNTSVCGI